MNSEKERPTAKISYEKPTAVDLGPTAGIVGASCAPGDDVEGGLCAEFGNSAAGNCYEGHAAALICDSGNSAGTCDTGSGGPKT